MFRIASSQERYPLLAPAFVPQQVAKAGRSHFTKRSSVRASSIFARRFLYFDFAIPLGTTHHGLVGPAYGNVVRRGPKEESSTTGPGPFFLFRQQYAPSGSERARGCGQSRIELADRKTQSCRALIAFHFLKLNLFAFKVGKLIMNSLHEVLARRFSNLGTGQALHRRFLFV
jgi:hypothetical protein